MGMEAVARQAESRVVISGLGPTGVEIAKNIVLAGCKELVLYDDMEPMREELSGQFFLSERDVDEGQKTRAEYSRDKLQQLNFYVKVSVVPLEESSLTGWLERQTDLKAVVLTDLFQFTHSDMVEIN